MLDALAVVPSSTHLLPEDSKLRREAIQLDLRMQSLDVLAHVLLLRLIFGRQQKMQFELEMALVMRFLQLLHTDVLEKR
jgi:hypothetical protein